MADEIGNTIHVHTQALVKMQMTIRLTMCIRSCTLYPTRSTHSFAPDHTENTVVFYNTLFSIELSNGVAYLGLLSDVALVLCLFALSLQSCGWGISCNTGANEQFKTHFLSPYCCHALSA